MAHIMPTGEMVAGEDKNLRHTWGTIIIPTGEMVARGRGGTRGGTDGSNWGQAATPSLDSRTLDPSTIVGFMIYSPNKSEWVPVRTAVRTSLS